MVYYYYYYYEFYSALRIRVKKTVRMTECPYKQLVLGPLTN